MTDTSAQRDSSIDAIKGAMIVLMVYGHISHAGSAGQMMSTVGDWIYTFHMPVFLIISGYFTRARLPAGRHLMMVLRRLWVPYAVFGLAYVVARYAAGRYELDTSHAPITSLSAWLLVEAALLGDHTGAMWYVYHLFFFQSANALAMWLWPQRPAARVCAVTAVILAASATPIVIHLDAIVYMVIGLLVRELGLPLFRGSVFILPALAALAVGIQTTTASRLSIPGAIWAISVLGTLTWLMALPACRVFRMCLACLGRNTLIVLLLHVGVLTVAKALIGPALRLEPTGIIFALAATIAGVALPILVSILLDTMQVSRLLFATPRLFSPFIQPAATPSERQP